jgi:hypothetical protein
LLKQHLSPTAYHLPTKENKLAFSVSIVSKQAKVCRFHFLFAENKRKLPFSVRSGNMEMKIWRHQTENGSPGIFSLIRLPFVVVGGETNGCHPFAEVLNVLNVWPIYAS